jgi:UDP-N-acetylglucosamine--N-acetylmuramyl-(pentapeptide) pyrophosphoryl-undecaprenol N-acetylglucosamine transferase
VPARGYALELVKVAPIRGGGLATALKGIGRAVWSLPEAQALLSRRRPQAVLSIGGYAAGPVSLVARAFRIPLALLEPNAAIGLSNRLVAPFVQRAYTAFAEVEAHFANDIVMRSGVPLRTGFAPKAYAYDPVRLRLLVLGGSQGARALNELVPEAVARVGGHVRVVHQTGPAEQARVRERYVALKTGDRAQVLSFIEDMPAALGTADLVIGRSGASAVSEICAVGRPSLLVPYPFAAADHQLKNAEALARGGAAVCLPASELTLDRLCAELDRLSTTRGLLEQMAEAARRLGRPDAALEVARDLLRLAGLDDTVPDTAEPSARRSPLEDADTGAKCSARYAEVA